MYSLSNCNGEWLFVRLLGVRGRRRFNSLTSCLRFELSRRWNCVELCFVSLTIGQCNLLSDQTEEGCWRMTLPPSTLDRHRLQAITVFRYALSNIDRDMVLLPLTK